MQLFRLILQLGLKMLISAKSQLFVVKSHKLQRFSQNCTFLRWPTRLRQLQKPQHDNKSHNGSWEKKKKKMDENRRCRGF